ncbi:hypothetical protein SNE40_018088 [Patella caerulea]|uniref:Uncharacterized protein n=1 Tax=Patella caerulea TaxID=87958 RepID=A0AAN8P6K0_PATCE
MSKGPNRVVVQSSKDFADAATSLLNKTTVIHISQEHIDNKIKQLVSWEETMAIPGIKKSHVVYCKANGEPSIYDNCLSTVPFIKLNHEKNDDDCDGRISIGDWCAVTYDGDNYPGEVTDRRGEDVEVSVMHRAGQYFKWPLTVDKIFYKPTSILKKITGPPVLVNVTSGSGILSEFPDFH